MSRLKTEVPVGTQYGKLTILKEVKPIPKERIFLCKCDCGNNIEVRMQSLKRGNTKSCGCLKVLWGEKSGTHRMSYTRFYRIWGLMVNRCTNKNNPGYAHYSKVGVCERWLKFANFKEDMYSTYADDLSIDRIDGSRGYSKENCRWASVTQQNNNRKDNVRITFENKTQTLAEWARIKQVDYHALFHQVRTRGKSLEQALNRLSNKT